MVGFLYCSSVIVSNALTGVVEISSVQSNLTFGGIVLLSAVG